MTLTPKTRDGCTCWAFRDPSCPFHGDNGTMVVAAPIVTRTIARTLPPGCPKPTKENENEC